MLTPYEKLEAAKVAREALKKLRGIAEDADLREAERDALLDLVITTLQASHL